MGINIKETDIKRRKIFPSPESHLDFFDVSDRRIYPVGEELFLEDKIFEEPIALCLNDSANSINIRNCEFRNGAWVRNLDSKKEISIILYKSNIIKNFSVSPHGIIKTLCIDTSTVDQLSISGRSNEIDIYASEINWIIFEGLKNDILIVEKTKIEKYSMIEFQSSYVNYDTDDLAIKDYNKFICIYNQNKKSVSENYHRIVLKSAKSLKSKTEINYQLSKATSSPLLSLFGYFYRPKRIVLFMMSIVFLYSILYYFFFGFSFDKSIYFSVITFLTIGYGDIDQNYSMLRTVLIFSEGLSGMIYSASLLISIMNSFKK
jgi:hypothetical protein